MRRETAMSVGRAIEVLAEAADALRDVPAASRALTEVQVARRLLLAALIDEASKTTKETT